MIKSFSKEHTLFCKGIAIFIMLFHHLFYRKEFLGMYFWIIPIHSTSLIQLIAYHCKICVAIFVFLSAYGLTISYTKYQKASENLKKKKEKNKLYILKRDLKFVVNKIKKLYLLYWPIFFISIAIGCISKTRIPVQVYSSFGQFIRDFLGLAYIIDGESPFMGSWWYISFALILYILFPLFYKAMNKYPKMSLIITFALGVHITTNVSIIIEIQRYFFIICLGICFANLHLFEKIFEKCSLNKLLIISILLCVVFFIIRCKCPFTFDGFFTIAIILLSVTLFEKKFINKFFMFFGKHSGNIFLIHGIIYKYWLIDFLYSLKYPIIILGILMVISLVFSIIIEYGKKKYLDSKNKILQLIQ